MALPDLIAELKAAQGPEPDDNDFPARALTRRTLHAVIIHLLKEGVPLELCAPLEHLYMALADISDGRSNELLKPAKMKPKAAKKPSLEALQLATAAAVATVLNTDAKWKLQDALREAAQAVSTDHRELAEFRKNLGKGRASAAARQQYTWALNYFRKDTKGRSPTMLASITATILRDLSVPGKKGKSPSS